MDDIEGQQVDREGEGEGEEGEQEEQVPGRLADPTRDASVEAKHGEQAVLCEHVAHVISRILPQTRQAPLSCERHCSGGPSHTETIKKTVAPCR
jgi:hypothetical protein